MQKHDLVQGSPEWLAYRMNHFNASDAPAMMGCSPYKARDALLLELHTGIAEEFSQEMQLVLAEGHRSEALARPLAEEILGEDLFPCVASDGDLSASFDGLSMLDDVNFEHKQLNARLRAAMVEGCTGADLPLDYQIQMEQQHMVSGAEKTLFMASKWDADGNLIEERHCWYYPNPDLAAKIRAGWMQFDQDLCNFTPPERTAVIVAAPVTALPAVSVQVSGAITLSHNFAAYEVTVRDFVENKLIREPKTDQDFANLELQIKAMKDGEAALDATEAQMLAQVAPIDAAKKTKDMLRKLLRDNRLMAEKLLDSEKARRKIEIVTEAGDKLRAHLASLTERLGGNYLSPVPADFVGAIKGLRSFDSMLVALDKVLVTAKLEASATADRIQSNLKTFAGLAGQHEVLFADKVQLLQKQPDDFTAAVKVRIADHQAAEEKKLEEDRKKIRDEGIQTRITRLVSWPTALSSNATSAVVAEKMAQIRAAEISETDFGERAAEAEGLRGKVLADLQALHDSLVAAEARAAESAEAPAVAPAPPPAQVAAPVVAAPPPAPVAGTVRYVSSAPVAASSAEVEMIGIGVLWTRLGLDDREAFLASIGFAATPASKGTGKLYRADDLQAIRRAIAVRMNEAANWLEAA